MADRPVRVEAKNSACLGVCDPDRPVSRDFQTEGSLERIGMCEDLLGAAATLASELPHLSRFRIHDVRECPETTLSRRPNLTLVE